jgi:hypothetical protein
MFNGLLQNEKWLLSGATAFAKALLSAKLFA